MKLIILAAGYATRLYPLTINQPKPLLKVSERPMIEHVIDHLKDVPELTGVIIISNEKFHGHFEKWASDYQISGQNIPVTVVNDKSTDENNRLGAIGDMVFAMNDQSVDEDVIVVAGDNLLVRASRLLENFAWKRRLRF